MAVDLRIFVGCIISIQFTKNGAYHIYYCLDEHSDEMKNYLIVCPLDELSQPIKEEVKKVSIARCGQMYPETTIKVLQQYQETN